MLIKTIKVRYKIERKAHAGSEARGTPCKTKKFQNNFEQLNNLYNNFVKQNSSHRRKMNHKTSRNWKFQPSLTAEKTDERRRRKRGRDKRKCTKPEEQRVRNGEREKVRCLFAWFYSAVVRLFVNPVSAADLYRYKFHFCPGRFW